MTIRQVLFLNVHESGPDLLRGRCGICRRPRAYRGLALYCAILQEHAHFLLRHSHSVPHECGGLVRMWELRTIKAVFHLATLFARRKVKTRIRHRDWLKLAGEKICHEQVGTVPTFLSVRANKVVKWKTDIRLPRLGIVKYAFPVCIIIMHVISSCAELSCDPVSTC